MKTRKSFGLTAILLTLLFACKNNAGVDPLPSAQLELTFVNSTSFTEANAGIEITSLTGTVAECGIVWSEKPNPGLSDNRFIVNNLREDQILNLLISNIEIGKTYYVRAYFMKGKEPVFAPQEISFTHGFSSGWQNIETPTLSPDEYIGNELSYFSQSFGGLRFQRVSKNNNTFVTTSYYPNFGQWDPSFFRLDKSSKPFFIEPFSCIVFDTNFYATLVGGGYTQLSKEKVQFNKMYVFDGLDGYRYPAFPGADVRTTAFGIGPNAFLIENKPDGVVWKYDFEMLGNWSKVAKNPVDFDAKILAASTQRRGFAMVEAEEWNNSKPNQLLEFDKSTNKWVALPPFPGEPRRRGVMVGYFGNVYYGLGQSVNSLKPLKDLWAFNLATKEWKRFKDYPGQGSVKVSVIPYDSDLYFGFGLRVSVNQNGTESFKNANDLWRIKVVN